MTSPIARPSDLSGKTIGRYNIVSLIGRGGMGEVYRAEDPVLKRTVALKRVAPHLRDNTTYRELLLKEAEQASRLNNERIAHIHDVLEEQGELFVVMEFVDGATLRSKIGEPFSSEEFLNLACQCLEGLVAAHANGIIHRDVKPENIMVTAGGGVKICDFGLAHTISTQDARTLLEDSYSTKNLRGTPAYMAPESLLDRPVDVRSDIFSLGIVLYEAMTGRHPFRTNDNYIATVDSILHSPPPPFPSESSLSPAFQRILLKALEKDPARRYASAKEMLGELRSTQLVDHRARPDRTWTVPALFAVMTAFVAGSLLYNRLPALSSRSEGRVLVVLPFRYSGIQPGAQAFTDGLIETVTAKLGQMTATHRFQIISANEVHSRHATSIDDALAEFGSDLALEGDVQKSEGNVRVNYALVDAHTRKQIGSESITLSAANAFDIQDNVVEGVARLLGLTLAPKEKAALAQNGTRTPGAYDFYLQGRGYLQNYDKPENLDNAVSVFQQALKLDANDALAYAGIGEALWRKYETITKDPRWIVMAEDNCEHALRLDDKSAASHTCIAAVQSGTGNYGRAILEFQRAIDLDRTNDDAYSGLARAYERDGQSAKAEATYKQAIDLRPQYWAGYSRLGAFYSSQRHYAEAEEMFDQVVRLAPDSYRGFSNLGAVYVYEDKTSQAISAFEKSMAIRRNYGAASNLGTLYFYNRDYRRALPMYREALNIQASDYVVWGNLAKTLQILNNPEAKTVFQHAAGMAEARLKVNPRDPNVRLNLAYFQAALGQTQPALKAIPEALALKPDDPRVLAGVAGIYALLKNDTASLEYLKRALQHGLPVREIDRDPAFAGMSTDPRFQQMKRSAK